MSLDKLLQKMEQYEEFARLYRKNGNGFLLGNHQLVPIYDAVENGLRRFVLAYGTGAGKTIIPIEIIKHFQSKGKNPRTLVIAPRQTLLENWNEETLQKYGCSVNVHRIEDKNDKNIPESAEFVTINYDKLVSRFGYVEALVEYAQNADLVVVDEFHNIKNRRGKISSGYQALIEASKNARLIALSASPIPDRLRDAGMMLYTIDPERYEHYKRLPFHINDDPEALWEMREQGKVRFFEMGAVAQFHKLPTFTELEPMVVQMPQEYVPEYFQQYKDMFKLGKVQNIERTAIEAMLHSPEAKEFLRGRLRQGHVLNFFSHLINGPEKGSADEAIFFQLEEMLREVGARNIASIEGSTSDRDRLQIQLAMQEGKLDALINQWDCTSEGFSEVAGNRPVSIIPLRSPFSPGRYVQIIGRSYRPGQLAPVEYVELHAHSDELLEMIDQFVHEHAAEKDLKVKSTWEPTVYHRDAYLIRKSKEDKIFLLFTQRSHAVFDQQELDVNSLSSYAHRLSQSRVIDFSAKEKSKFGSGVREVGRFVGRKYDSGLKDNAEPLGRDYALEDIILYAPGKVNFVLAEAIENIKEREGATGDLWKIADLGCCSSAVFSQVQLVHQAMQEHKGKRIGLDYIVNVDGHPGFVRSARHHLESKIWTKAISSLSAPDFSAEEMAAVQQQLRESNYMERLDFRQANFTTDDFGSGYDVVITSQCLQYNDQTTNRDVEKVVANVNGSLRYGGHYLTILTGNSHQKSFTRPQDVESFKRILGLYGFRVESYGHISGKKGKQEVLKPLHYVHAIKVGQHTNGLVNIDVIPVMYDDTIERLTGGYKIERFSRTPPKVETKTSPLPDVYIDGDGRGFKF